MLALCQLMVERQILRNCQVGEQRRVLIDDLDPLTDGLDGMELREDLAVNDELACIGGVHT